MKQKIFESKEFKTYQQDPCYQYKLVGVVVHQGSSAEHGHYISFINTERGDPAIKKNRYQSSNYLATENDKWLEFNDQTVRHFSFSQLQSECFGSNLFSSSSSSSAFADDGFYSNGNSTTYTDMDQKRCAYMLVYERVRKKDIRIALTKQQADLALKKEAETQQKIQKEKSLLEKLKIYQRLEKYHQSDPLKINYNQEEKQYVQQINFYSVPRFIPKCKANEIWKENNEFLFYEYWLYSQEFFDFVMILAEKCWSKIQNLEQEVKIQMEKNDSEIKMLDQSEDNSFNFITPEASQQILRKLMHICYIAVFRLLARTTNNNQIANISAILCKILKKDGALAREFMSEFILNAEGSLGSATFVHQLLLQSPDKQTRSNIAKIIAACVNSLFPYEASYLFETQVIEQNGAADENQKMTVPKALCIRYMNLVISMIQKGEIVKNWTRFEDFFAFIAEVAQAGQLQREFMIKNKFIALQLDMYLGPNSPLCPPHIKRDTIGNQYAKPNFSQIFTSITHLLNGLEQKSLTQEKNDSTLQLSQADKICLLNKSFFKKAIKESKQVAGQLVPLIVLQCRDNLQNSRTIAKILTRSINDADFESAPGILQILEPFVLIDDQYQLNRIQWIFGFPQPNIRSCIIQSQYQYKGSTTQSSLPFLGIYQNPSFNLQAHTYNTSITKYSSIQSFTHVAYSKRIRQETCAMFMMLSMWKMIMVNDVFKDYILSLPPISYDYGSFHDYWIKIANNFISETQRYSNRTLRNTAGSMAQLLKDEIEKVINQWKEQKIQSIENKQQRERLRDVNKLIDQQYDGAIYKRPYVFDYIICRVTEQKKIQEVTKYREINDQDALAKNEIFPGRRYNSNFNNNNSQSPQFVSMVITQLEGEIITPSLPNGNKNLAIEQYQRNKGINSSSYTRRGGGRVNSGFSGGNHLFQNKLSKSSKKSKQNEAKMHKKNKSGMRQKKAQSSQKRSTISDGKKISFQEYEEEEEEEEYEEQDNQKRVNTDQADIGSNSQQQKPGIESFNDLTGKNEYDLEPWIDKNNEDEEVLGDDEVQQQKSQILNQSNQIQDIKPKIQKVVKTPIQRTKQFKFTKAKGAQNGDALPRISIIQSQPQDVYRIAKMSAETQQDKEQDQLNINQDKDLDIHKDSDDGKDKKNSDIDNKDNSSFQKDENKNMNLQKQKQEKKQSVSSDQESGQQSQEDQISGEQQKKKQKQSIDGQLLTNINFLYRVSFYNGSNQVQRVYYSVRPKYPNRNQNLWLPVNEFTCQVTQKYQRHCFHLIKKDPLNNIPEENEFQVIWRIQDHNSASKQRKKAMKQKQNLSHLIFPPQENENTGGDNDGNNASAASAGREMENQDPPPKGLKHCTVCTYLMAESSKRCQMCDTLQ